MGVHFSRRRLLSAEVVAAQVAMDNKSASLNNGAGALDFPATSLSILHISLEDFSTAASPIFSAFPAEPSNNFATPSTPYLEQLAARGTVFRRAFCQAPICNPSRTSIMTSRRPSATRVFTNDDPYHANVPASVPNLVQFLKAASPEASIACASGSKLFHIACDKDAMAMDVAAWPLDIPALPPAVRSAASFILSPPGPYSADQHRARVALARLLRYASQRQRFYLGVGFVETHAFDEKVCHVDVGVATSRGRLAASSPPDRGTEKLPPLITWPNFDFWRTQSAFERRKAIGTYYGCATHVDGTIGALLASLDALELSSRTAVIVHGDHGFSLGRHGRWSKYNLYEDATRVPLIIATPGGRAKVVDDVVESLDVMPTILELWGVKRVPAPPQAAAAAPSSTAALPHYPLNGAATPLEGDSLLPYLGRIAGGVPMVAGTHGRVPRRRRFARSELHLPCGLGCCMLNQPYDGLPPGYTRTPTVGDVVQLYIRTRRWAYTLILSGVLPARGTPLRIMDEALYDAEADLGESLNLAYYSSHSHTRYRLLQVALREWNVTARVQGPLNESRWQRAEWLRAKTGFRRDWWKR